VLLVRRSVLGARRTRAALQGLRPARGEARNRGDRRRPQTHEADGRGARGSALSVGVSVTAYIPIRYYVALGRRRSYVIVDRHERRVIGSFDKRTDAQREVLRLRLEHEKDVRA
jgi:hypothetical protein